MFGICAVLLYPDVAISEGCPTRGRDGNPTSAVLESAGCRSFSLFLHWRPRDLFINGQPIHADLLHDTDKFVHVNRFAHKAVDSVLVAQFQIGLSPRRRQDDDRNIAGSFLSTYSLKHFQAAYA